MKRPISNLINEVEAPVRETREFVTSSRCTRQAFITTMRDLADTKAEMKTLFPTGPNILEPHARYLIRSYLEKMLAGAAALAVDLRCEEAHAVLSAADLIVELSRSDDLRDEMAQAFMDYERMIAEMRRSIEGVKPVELRTLRALIKEIGEREARET